MKKRISQVGAHFKKTKVIKKSTENEPVKKKRSYRKKADEDIREIINSPRKNYFMRGEDNE
jgi:hypothetical protein